MAIMAIYRSANVRPEHYRPMLQGTAAEAPQGAIAHFAGFAGPGKFCVVDVWESRAQYEAFVPKLLRVLKALGIPEEEPEIYELHGMIATELVPTFAAQFSPL